MKIARTYVHEAGHAIATLALGYCVHFIQKGPFWEGSIKSGFLDVERNRIDGRNYRIGHFTKPDDAVISVSGFVAEAVWTRVEPNIDKFRNEHSYESDRDGVVDCASDIKKSEALLKANRPVLVWVAHKIRDAGYRLYGEELEPVKGFIVST